jgi:small-conductance mechanosensitive channel
VRAFNPSIIFLLVIAGAFLIGGVVYFILSRLIRRLVRRTDSALDDKMAKRLRRPLRLLILLGSIAVAWPYAPVSAELSVPLHHAFIISSILLGAWLAISLVRVIEQLVVHHYDASTPNNLRARVVQTQARGLGNIVIFVIGLLGAGSALMTFDSIRQIGVSVLASAGIAGVIVGFAAQKSISAIVAGIQVALTQPIRVDDVVIVEGEWGRIEEITLTYVVVCIWDLRRLVVPINYFIENPFQNWTRTSADLLGTVSIHVDYTVPVEQIREELQRLVKDNPAWDGKVCRLQVTEARESTVVLRAVASAVDSGAAWDLRCSIRESLIEFIQRNHPSALPKVRADLEQPSIQ